MYFKYPEVLYALFLLVIPLLVHLLKLRKLKKEAFTNVRFLQKVVRENRKSNQLKKWLVLTARTLSLAALILAFAQPYFPASQAARQSNTSLVYLDNSFSMQLRGEHGPMLDHNIQEILRSTEDDQMFGLFTNSNDYGFIKPSENLSLFQNIEYTPKSSHFDIINLKAQQFFKEHPAEMQRLIIASDFQQNFGELKKLENVEYHFIKNSPQKSDNISIDSAFIANKTSTQLTLKTIFSSNTVIDRDIAVSLKDGNRILSKNSINFKEHKQQEAEFKLKAQQIDNGSITIEDQGLRYDNQLFFSYAETPKIKVLSISGVEADFLKRIFTKDEFDYINFPENAIDFSAFSDVDFILLNEVDKIDTDLQNQIIEKAKQGISICVILPENVQEKKYSQFLSILGLPGITSQENKETQITDIAFSHPLFASTFEKEISNFQYPQVQQFYKLNQKGNAALSFQNQNPFLIGNGNTYLFSSAINKNNSNFQNSPLIVPVFYNMATAALKNPNLYAVVGREHSFDINFEGNKDEIVEIQLSPEESFIPIQQKKAEKISITTTDLPDKAGNFKLQFKNNPAIPLSYNYARQESELEYLDISAFENIEQSSSVKEFFQSVNAIQQNDALWKWFVIFALIFLTIEMLLLKFFK